MMYDELLGRSFSKNEKKKLGFWAVLLGCFIIVLSCVCAAFMGPPLPLLNLGFTTRSTNFDGIMKVAPTPTSDNQDNKIPRILDNHDDVGLGENPKSTTSTTTTTTITKSVICNLSSPKSDFCEINSPVQIHGPSSTIYIISNQTHHHQFITLKPYGRKDPDALRSVTQFSLNFSSSSPFQCTINHTIPSILFSTGGYTGNHFHEFTDILIPLYLTSLHYNTQVQFLITNYKSWWVHKYQHILTALSNHKPININNETSTHCFPSMIIGLKAHNKEFGINPSPLHNYSMPTFTQFLRNIYSLPRNSITITTQRKPRLLIISRNNSSSRLLLNEKEVAIEARRVGFQVEIIVSNSSYGLSEFAGKVNSFDVYLGVHGAGMTNIVFLPVNAVVIQVVPLGLEWLSKHDFELPAKEMGLNYLEYKVSEEESTVRRRDLSIKFGQPGWWIRFKKVYLDGQNVRVDLRRFRGTLIKARQILQHDLH